MNLKNIFKGAGQIVPGLINTVVSIVKDKKETENPENLLAPPLGSPAEWLATGVKLSSKRLLNISGTGTIMAIAVKEYLSNGLDWPVVALFALGAVYAFGMSWVTQKSEQ